MNMNMDGNIHTRKKAQIISKKSGHYMRQKVALFLKKALLY
jgi:hypothetical protein